MCAAMNGVSFASLHPVTWRMSRASVATTHGNRRTRGFVAAAENGEDNGASAAVIADAVSAVGRAPRSACRALSISLRAGESSGSVSSARCRTESCATELVDRATRAASRRTSGSGLASAVVRSRWVPGSCGVSLKSATAAGVSVADMSGDGDVDCAAAPTGISASAATSPQGEEAW